MNAVFITDHGSSRVTSRRARRGPLGRLTGTAFGASAGATGVLDRGDATRGSAVVAGSNVAPAGRAPAGGPVTPLDLVAPELGAGEVTGMGAVDPARPAPTREAVPSVSTDPAP